MDTRNIHKDAEWIASYEKDQCKGLIICQQLKIKQLTELIEKIEGEMEQTEYAPEMIMESIKTIIQNTEEIEHIEGIFKWIG